MAKNFYVVAEYKAPGILRESMDSQELIFIEEGENMMEVVERERARGAWTMNICPTMKQADAILERMNRSCYEQERKGWRDNDHAEEIYSDGILITEDTYNDLHRVIDVSVERYIENVPGSILTIDSGKVTELNDVPGLTRHEIGVANALIEKYAPQHGVRFGEHVKEEEEDGV